MDLKTEEKKLNKFWDVFRQEKGIPFVSKIYSLIYFEFT